MKDIKVGVIGCGFIHNVHHMPACRRIPEAEVVAVCAATKQEVQPSETFEDGLLVNKIVDAASRSVKSRRWENV